MENDIPCPIHPGVMMTARTGQYGTFWSHSIPNVGFCDGKKIKPFKPQGGVQTVPSPQSIAPSITREPLETPDWDKIAEGKVRHGVVVAVIEHGGLDALKGQLAKIEKITEYIMTGKYSEEVN